MLAYPKIGIHTAVGGNPTGIGDYIRQVDTAGRQTPGRKALVMCADGTTGLSDAYALIDQGSPVPHVLAWRKVSGPLSENDPEFYGVPDYNLPPSQAAANHWGIIKPTIPPEVTAHKAHTWIVPINEPDKNRAHWLGLFAVEMAELMNADGYKCAMFGWSAGEPEPTDWQTSGMIAYLEYCAAHPQMAAVALHEYSFDQQTIWTGKDAQGNIIPINPDTDELVLVGRFLKLFAACDAQGIARPKVLITEWGWEQNDVPEPAIAMQHIDDAMARLYAHYPEVEIPGLWYTGPGYGGVANQAQKLIAPIAQHAISRVYEVDGNPPLPGREPRTIKHTIHLLPQDTTGQELDAVTNYLHPSRTAFTYSHDVIEAVMYHSKPTGNIFIWDAHRWNFDPLEQFGWLGVGINLKLFSEIGLPPGDPFAGLELGAPFDEPFAITGLVGDPRDYGLHEGVDADIFTSLPNSTEPVRCIYPGTVIAPPRPVAGYGPHLVVVRSEYNGHEMIFWYAHMDQHFVQVGDQVQRGQPLGELGDEGNTTGEHIHITWQTPGQGMGGFFLPDIRDPLPYMSLEPEPVGVDMADFFLPASGQYGPVYRLSNNWGAGDEIVQLQRSGDRSYVVKNQQYEQRFIDLEHIDLELDTSPGGNEFYRVVGHWLPRFMESGQVFQRTEQVAFFNKSTCQPGATYTSTSLIKLQDVSVRVWGGQSLLTIELAWVLNGQTEEIYTYGVGVGLLKWLKVADGRMSQFSGWLPGHENLQREPEPCV